MSEHQQRFVDPTEKVNEARVLLRQGRIESATALLMQIVECEPNRLDAVGQLGNAFALAGQWEQAAAAFARVVQLNPKLPQGYFGHGAALARLAKDDEAVASFEAALSLGYLPAHCNLGVALAKVGQYARAAEHLGQAIALQPNDAVARWNDGLLRLLAGQWGPGFAHYEWRLGTPEFTHKVRRIDRPLWCGEDLAGQAILIHDEQGFGDAILFARFLSPLAERGATVALLCQPPLAALLRTVAGVSQTVTGGQPLPPVDFHLPMGSLPHRLGVKQASDLRPAPYLFPDPARVRHWADRLPPRRARKRVGLAWHGNPLPNPARSIPPQALSPLLACDVEFVIVQKQPAEPHQRLHPTDRVIDLSTDLNDFADTAALMCCLDQVVSIDTAAAHVAGALGIPTLLLLPHVADWRWLLDRTDSPWFPSLRLLRQPRAGDWASVIQAAAGLV